MSIRKYFYLAVFAALQSASFLSFAQRESDPLEPIVRCVREGKFGLLEDRRLPASAKSRTVETLKGPRSVSTLDGYRLMLSTPQGKPFVNLKIELSAAESAVSDREAVLAQMDAMSARRSPQQAGLQKSVVSGIDILALNQPTLESGGPVGFYSMFAPARSVIASLYLLNPAPAGSAFATYAEYEALRDEATNLVRGCLASSGA